MPFCSLPSELRSAITRGFREGRSPDILAVAGSTPIAGGSRFGPRTIPWPSTAGSTAVRVPLVFAGTGVSSGEVAGTPGLDDVAPTVAAILDIRRPHPEVRSGEEIAGVASGERPRLVLEIVWKGVSTDDLESSSEWPNLARLLDKGAGTLEARVPSQPLDPGATLTTIGTGGLPSEHGITGILLRNDSGELVTAWGPGSPINVIATLGDDLDERMGQRPIIGLVAKDVVDRGLIGGRWYLGGDRDDVSILPPATSLREQIELVGKKLDEGGFGADSEPDVLAVSLQGPLAALDAQLPPLISAAERASGGSAAVVVTATGPGRYNDSGVVDGESVKRRLEEAIPQSRDLVEAVAPGGLFIDQDALADLGLSDDVVLEAALELRGTGDAPIFEDVFPSLAVTFGRYC